MKIVEEGKLAWAPTKECKPGCLKASWTGLGDSHHIPVGADLHWQEMRAAEAGAKPQSKSRIRVVLRRALHIVL